MVQFQELQDKVNFLNEEKEFYDPETARSSGLSLRATRNIAFSLAVLRNKATITGYEPNDPDYALTIEKSKCQVD